MAVVELHVPRRQILVDERGDALRATWHSRERTILVSHWRDDVCRGTFRLTPADAARLAGFLVTAIGEDLATPTATSESASPPDSLLDRVLAVFRLRRA
jgi:hypothetical protein